MNAEPSHLPLLAAKDYTAASLFEPANLLREARRQKNCPTWPSPQWACSTRTATSRGISPPAAEGAGTPDGPATTPRCGRSMLSAAASAQAGTPVMFVRAAAERLPFPAAMFDLVMATLTYRHWAAKSAGIAEIGRVLACGGVLGLAAVLTPLRSSPRWSLRRVGRARLPASLVVLLAGAGLRIDGVENIGGLGAIPEVTFVLARAIPER